MVRRHGWQLPAHTFQVVAITVFLLLMVAFYIFFAPFLGSSILEHAAIAVYSPVAFAVCILYFRSTAIDPSDPGVLEKRKQRSHFNLDKLYAATGSLVNANTNQAGPSKSPLGLSTPARSSSVAHSDKDFDNKASWMEEGRQTMGSTDADLNRNLGARGIGGIVCGWLVQDDNCKGDGLGPQPSGADEEALFCTLCDVEVRKFSKHCRNCDKCVDGFDHHCRWLNNCVGRKNYITFVVLMAASLLLLVLNCGTGVAVVVRCFVDKSSIERQILVMLGSGFSRTPFAVVVVICTLVSLLALIPLAELFFFHLILMRKGISTYEYVMAMRELQGVPDGEEESMPTSPTSSTATGLSGSSSIGLHHRGAWCTPPRVFVENQDEVVPHLAPGRVPSTVDPDATNLSLKPDGKTPKSAVRISAWKLAKLDANEAAHAAAKARHSSSVLRPLKMQDSSIVETDYTTTMSSSSVSTELGHRGKGSVGTGSGRDAVGFSPQQLGFPFGQVGSKSDVVDTTRSQSSCSSPTGMSVNDSVRVSPFPSQGRLKVHGPPAQIPFSAGQLGLARPPPKSHATRVESLDALSRLRHVSGAPAYDEYLGQTRASQLNQNLRESKRTAIFWSGEAGGFRSTIERSSFDNMLEGKSSSSGSAGAVAESCPQALFAPGNAVMHHSSSANESVGEAPGVPGNLLLYNGASIFFGGPICTPGSSQPNNPGISNTLASTAFAGRQVAASRVRNQDSRHLQGHTLRTHCPVFTPSSLHI